MSRKALVGFVGLGLLVSLFLWPSLEAIDPRLVPPRGFVVGEAFGTTLPGGGRILIVSEDCEICLQRRNAYARIVARMPSDVVVAVQTGGDQQIERELLRGDPGASGFLVLSQQELVGSLRVHAFPVSVTIDRDRRVVHTGRSRDGMLSSIGGPLAWIEAWKQLLFGQA